jgi:hypothetical protein
VREWSRDELARLLSAHGFTHADVGLTRSSLRDDSLRTILGLCYCDEPTRRRATRRPV